MAASSGTVSNRFSASTTTRMPSAAPTPRTLLRRRLGALHLEAEFLEPVTSGHDQPVFLSRGNRQPV